MVQEPFPNAELSLGEEFYRDRGEFLEAMETVIRGLKQNEGRPGAALLRIRDHHLYREAGFKTFTQYLLERWRWTRQYAYQLIRAHQLNESVKTFCQQNERIPLGKAVVMAALSPETQKALLEREDFSNLSVRELKAVAHGLPSHNRTPREVRTTLPKPEKLAKEITRLLQRYWPTVSGVEFVHDTQGRVSVIEVRHG
jgi:hypothetical protein